MISGIAGLSSYYSMYRYSGYSRSNPYIRAQAQEAPQVSSQGAAAVTRTSGAGSHMPVQPVPPVNPVVSGAQESQSPGIFIRKGVDPVEFAVRMRIRYEDPADMPGQTGQVSGPGSARETAEEGKCQTCEERRYQDGSDDMGVSFQTPTRIAPENVASAVRGHERENVFREQAKAQRENRRVISQSVALHTSVCPECGKAYISGGTTTTTTASAPDPVPAGQPQRRPFSAVA